MKKLLSLLLALMLCLSLAACGGDDADDGDDAPPVASDTGNADDADTGGEAGEPDAPETGGDYCTNYAVMGNFDMYEVPPVDMFTAAPWSLSGGYNNRGEGMELTLEELRILLEEDDLEMQVEFVDEENAKLVLDTAETSGTYRILDDGVSINFDFVAYVGMFTTIGEDETPALVILTPAAPEMVFILTN